MKIILALLLCLISIQFSLAQTFKPKSISSIQDEVRKNGDAIAYYDESNNESFVGALPTTFNIETSGSAVAAPTLAFGFSFKGKILNRLSLKYTLAIFVKTKDGKAFQSTELNVFADGKKIVLGYGKSGNYHPHGDFTQSVFYDLSEKDFAAFAESKTIRLKIGGYQAILLPDNLRSLKKIYALSR